MFWPTWPSSVSANNIQNFWEVDCNIKFYKKKLDVIFTLRVKVHKDTCYVDLNL